MKNEYSNIINDLNGVFQLVLRKSVYLTEKKPGLFVACCQDSSVAINNRKNNKSQVSVINWFSNFWVYFELKFINKNIFLSLSVFQGESSDTTKNQLFRAEWDNYDNNEEHPQPHWHIYPVKYENKTYEDFEAFMEISNDPTFSEIVSSNITPLINISRFHFALNGNWYENGGHIVNCKFEESKKLSRWLSGLLIHVKSQLDFVSQK